MKHITLNGIQLTVATKKEVKEIIGSHDDWLDMGHDLLLYGLRTKRDYVVAAGLDESKIDYALPEDWVSSHGFAKRDEIARHFAWSYANDSTFGGTLDIRTLKQDIFKAVLAQLVQP